MLLSGTSLFPDLADAELGSGFYSPGSVPSTTIVLNNPGDQSNEQGEAVSLQILGSGGGAVLYAATGLPPGLAIDLTSGLISGNVTGNGPYEIAVLATDGFSQAELSFLWEVDSPLTLEHSLAYSVTGLPDGLSLDSETGLISGTLGDAGRYRTTIIASSGGAASRQTFTWDVRSPVALLTPGDQDSKEGDAVSLSIQAGGISGAVLSYSATGLPDGLEIDANTGVVTGVRKVSGTGVRKVSGTDKTECLIGP